MLPLEALRSSLVDVLQCDPAGTLVLFDVQEHVAVALECGVAAVAFMLVAEMSYGMLRGDLR